MRRLTVAACLCFASVALAIAQSPQPASPLIEGAKVDHRFVKTYLTKAADQVPENLYTFSPTPEVRTFAQIFAHVADSNYEICASAAGEKPPVQGIEKSQSGKAAIVKALGESFTYCDKVLASTTDANAAKQSDFFGHPAARLTILGFNTSHNNEHYGNIVTYMRINKMVPPSSQR